MKVERGGRVFPVSDNAFDVVDKLRYSLLKKDINIVTDSYVYSIDKKDKFIVKTNNGIYRSDGLIIATGGASYPTTGSDGNGYCLASNFGHNIIDIKPALVAIDLNDEWTSDMAGISLKNIELKLFKDKKLIRTEFGELIFTHSGISGPTVLRMSSHMDNNLDYSLSIDLKPGLDFQSLDSRIQKDFIKYNNKDFKNSLFDLTIKAMIPLIINQANIDEHKVINQITKSERHRLVEVFKNFKLNYKGLKDIKYGIVTRGGLCVDEINPSTMESKIIDNLYFSGEILDVDANTGGYNLQFAFSSGYLAGINCGGI